MEVSYKKHLLMIADSISKDINNQQCGNYVSNIVNAIKIAQDRNSKEVFFQVLNKMKYIEWGGEAERIGYVKFVDSISKNPHYEINSLNLNDLEFVFSWVRRLVNIRTKSKGNNNYDYKKTSSRGGNKIKYQDETKIDYNDSPFAKLKDYKF